LNRVYGNSKTKDKNPKIVEAASFDKLRVSGFYSVIARSFSDVAISS